ncbi:MAG: hypothetical protein SGPRY_003763 [Prymnesium sp.]
MEAPAVDPAAQPDDQAARAPPRDVSSLPPPSHESAQPSHSSPDAASMRAAAVARAAAEVKAAAGARAAAQAAPEKTAPPARQVEPVEVATGEPNSLESEGVREIALGSNTTQSIPLTPPRAVENEPQALGQPPSVPAPIPSSQHAITIPPSAGAVKFIGTMNKVSGELSSLQAVDVSDGLFEWAQQSKSTARSKLLGFKDHLIDLAVAMFADEERKEGESRVMTLRRTVNGRELLKLPLAGMHALFALLFILLFAVLHVPRKYGPICYAYSKNKVSQPVAREDVLREEAHLQVMLTLH